VIDFAYRGPAPGKPISSIVSDYATYFPVLANCQRWDYQADNIALYIALRKIKDAPFRLPLERSTSVVREPVGHSHLWSRLQPSIDTGLIDSAIFTDHGGGFARWIVRKELKAKQGEKQRKLLRPYGSPPKKVQEDVL